MVATEEFIVIPLKNGGKTNAKEIHNSRGTIIAIDEETGIVFYSSIPQRTWKQSNRKRRWEQHRSCKTFIEDRKKRLAKIEENYEEFGKLRQKAEDILTEVFQKTIILVFLQKTKNALKGRTNKQLSAARTIAKEHFAEHNRLVPTTKEKKEELVQAVSNIASLLETRQTKLSRVRDKYEAELKILQNLLQPPTCAVVTSPEPF
ncbi:hypothetical protein KKA15_00230 [Patescibacteria group bacterium]|nr:hypothetical protein [Patescibacteria group bacterium]